MDPHRLGDLVADLVVGVQRRHRVLEDHRDLLAPHGAHLVGGQRQQVLTLEDDLALDLRLLPRIRPITVRNDTLLPEPDSPTTPSVTPSSVNDAVDGLHETVVGREVDAEVLDLEERFRHLRVPHPRVEERVGASTRFATAMKNAPNSVTPITEGKSLWIACTAYWPIPAG